MKIKVIKKRKARPKTQDTSQLELRFIEKPKKKDKDIIDKKKVIHCLLCAVRYL